MIEKLVTSLEVSQKLKDVGFEVETPFWWNRTQSLDGNNYVLTTVFDPGSIAAYTFEQLFSVLPYNIRIDGLAQGWKLENNGVLDLFSEYSDYLQINATFDESNLANTAAQAILWCIEKGYIQV